MVSEYSSVRPGAVVTASTKVMMLQLCWNTTNQSHLGGKHSEKHFESLLWHFTLLWPLFGALPRVGVTDALPGRESE